VKHLSILVLPNFKDDRKKSAVHPTDRDILLWDIRATIQPIRP
jgi:hypothetical protein